MDAHRGHEPGHISWERWRLAGDFPALRLAGGTPALQEGQGDRSPSLENLYDWIGRSAHPQNQKQSNAVFLSWGRG